MENISCLIPTTTTYFNNKWLSRLSSCKTEMGASTSVRSPRPLEPSLGGSRSRWSTLRPTSRGARSTTWTKALRSLWLVCWTPPPALPSTSSGTTTTGWSTTTWRGASRWRPTPPATRPRRANCHSATPARGTRGTTPAAPATPCPPPCSSTWPREVSQHWLAWGQSTCHNIHLHYFQNCIMTNGKWRA